MPRGAPKSASYGVVSLCELFLPSHQVCGCKGRVRASGPHSKKAWQSKCKVPAPSPPSCLFLSIPAGLAGSCLCEESGQNEKLLGWASSEFLVAFPRKQTSTVCPHPTLQIHVGSLKTEGVTGDCGRLPVLERWFALSVTKSSRRQIKRVFGFLAPKPTVNFKQMSE